MGAAAEGRLLPKGAPNHGNILTIDIPPEWEGTQCPQSNPACGANGPRFFARTGCKYSIEHNLAQCETGTCGDAYDCGKQALRNPPLADSGKAPLTIVEWTFNSQGGQGYNYPDISLVDGLSITADVQAIGEHCASKPGAPSEPNWLSQNQPLAIHGADLREAKRCIPTFRLTRGEVGQIIQGQGNPDAVVGCFTNCGRYESCAPSGGSRRPGGDCHRVSLGAITGWRLAAGDVCQKKLKRGGAKARSGGEKPGQDGVSLTPIDTGLPPAAVETHLSCGLRVSASPR